MSWDKYNEAGNWALCRGLYDEAEVNYKQALKEAEKLGVSDPCLSESLRNLAKLCLIQDKHSEAEELSGKALTVDETVWGPEHLYVGVDLEQLAEAYRMQDKYAEARPVFLRALPIYETSYGLEHEETSKVLNKLILLHLQEGRYGEIEVLHKRSLLIYQKISPPGGWHSYLGLEKLMSSYCKQHKYTEAELIYKRELAILRNILGSQHPDIASVLSGYSDLLRKTKRSLAAAQLKSRAAAMEAKEDIEHKALLYLQQGKYNDAEKLYRLKLALLHKQLGATHLDVARVLGKYAQLLRAMKRFNDAESLEKRARHILGSKQEIAGSVPDNALPDLDFWSLWLWT